MQIVLDTNVLLSALIKDSTTRKLILEYEGKFLLPLYSFEEFEKYQEEIFQKSRIQKEDFRELLDLILNKVTLVSSSSLIPYREEAYEIIKNIDLKDILFVACALAHKDSIIWSNDSDLKNKQSKINVINTKEAIEILTSS